MEQKYTPSGTSTIQGIIITLIIGILAAIVVPVMYIILGRLIPNIWFIAIIAMLVGFGVGLFIDLGIKMTKIRNKKVAIGIAVFCGLLAFYIQWVVFDDLMYSDKGFTFNLSGGDLKILAEDMFFLFTHPGILFQEISRLNVGGTFRVSSENVSGILLWAIWAGEFVFILGSTIYAVYAGQVNHPFSEQNNEWMKKRKTPNRIPMVEDKEVFLHALNNRNFAVLNDDLALANAQNFGEVVIFESNGDPTKYLSVANVLNPTGKQKDLKRVPLIKFFPLNNANI